MNTDLSFSVLTANLISLLLLGTLYLSNRQRMNNDKDMQLVQQMMQITALSNAADLGVYYLDSSAGAAMKIVVFLCGSWLYMGNVLIGYTWAKFLVTHLGIPFTERRKTVYRSGTCVGSALLLLNLFYPLVFTNKDGLYQRGPAYGVFLLFAVLYIGDSLYLYAKNRRKIGTLKLFPVAVFLVPIAVGVLVQAMFVEIAITWTSIAIAIAGVMTALKNETIYLDRLTGLYNRGYLEYLQKQAGQQKSSWVSGIMIDLNSFKQINDNYGHSEGDEALKTVAKVLRKSFDEYGVVTRYAGDEFVVMLNTTDEQLVQNLIDAAKQNFEEESKAGGKPYQLSASMGYAVSDLKNETMADFMNRIDARMYQDKLAYYKANDRRKR